MKLTSAMETFVLHWGEMGTKWGINRSVAQIHALLYVTPKALHAEEICEILGLARSNVSTSLKELQTWRIVRVVHVMGDRRDHFESIADVWEIFRVIMEERKRREIDPTLSMLRECLDEAAKGGASEKHTKERLGAMHDFIQTMTTSYEDFNKMPTSALKRMVKSGSKIMKLIGGR